MHTHGDLPQDVRDTVDLWISDFFDRPAARAVAAPLGEAATSVLVDLVTMACDERGPAALSEAALAHALLDHGTALSLPAPAKAAIPDLVAAFLGDCEDVGRLADGRLLASHVRALAPTFRARASGQGTALRRPAEKIGRNDPCPCGSGKKYKQCCLNALG